MKKSEVDLAWAALSKAVTRVQEVTGKNLHDGKSTAGFAIHMEWRVTYPNQKPLKTWHWRLMSTNGEIVASSEAYSSRAKCLQTAKRVAGEANWEIKQ